MINRYAFRGNNNSIPLSSLVFSISELMDYGYHNPLEFHQLKTSYICRLLARELGISGKDFEDIVIAAALHDIGLIKFMDKKKILQDDESVIYQHTLIGCNILKRFTYTKKIAEYVCHHHTPWDVLKAQVPYKTAISSNIIYLADRVEVFSRRLRPLIFYTDHIKETLKKLKKHFAPEILDAFFRISEKDLFWLRLECFKKETEVFFDSQYISMIPRNDIKELAILLALLIDAKSPFTRMHSQGVALICKWLGAAFGMKGMELELLEVAGYLHDLGKLAIPEGILDKPGKLTPEEWSIMKSHVFFTYRALEQIPNFSPVHLWAAQHHERLDGKGYPAGLTEYELPLASRIVAVADVTTALLERRPYRKEMSPKEAAAVLEDMTKKGLDPQITRLVINNIDYAHHLIREAEGAREEEYIEVGLQAS